MISTLVGQITLKTIFDVSETSPSAVAVKVISGESRIVDLSMVNFLQASEASGELGQPG